MAHFATPVIPKGSTVLVTAANSLVGSNIADQALNAGYRVRGTVRTAAKGAWLVSLFDEKYTKGTFELVEVPEMAIDGAYDEAVKGVAAVFHAASILTFSPDPHKVIPATIDGALGALKSAHAEPSVKRFVLTSSSSSAAFSFPGLPGIVVTDKTWNEQAIKMAWADPPYTPQRGGIVYAASKTQAEQEVWKFHRENKHKRPDLVLNTVLPNLVMGQSLDLVNQGHPSSSGFIVGLWKGKTDAFGWLARQYFCNTVDVGLLHLAAAIHPDVKEERVFAYGGRVSWDAILEILRKQNPHRKFIDNFSGGDDPNEIEPRVRAEQLLRDMGKSGWTSLEDTVRLNTEDLHD